MKNNRILLFVIIILVILPFNGFSTGSKESDNHIENNDIFLQLDNSSYSERLARAVNNHSDISFSVFNGIDTITLLNTGDGDELEIEFTSKINKGNFKLVFISPDDEIIVLLNQSQNGIKKLIPGKGVSRIKIMGKDASGILSLSINGHKDIEFQRLGQE